MALYCNQVSELLKSSKKNIFLGDFLILRSVKLIAKINQRFAKNVFF